MKKTAYSTKKDGDLIVVRRSTDGKTIEFMASSFDISVNSRREAIGIAKMLPDHTWG